ncbi:FixH protein [Salinimicrobium catena]|uniref:FixH protein n=1 Tax=Salinimicrobium catena TaxID=390640 RepID=A0A1H5HCM3_9FLAO|nr:FixH family protein [Salinimicrobium catena]SDK69260.1 FixH protein [Salinimicrobium catena]SEE25766.1 FixH protein [Salinimicrobium catena]
MKINWGAGIVLAIIGFVSFILFLVITMSTDKAYSHDLVTEEYYKTELEFQQQLNKESNAQHLSENIKIEKSSEGLIVHFPEELDPSQIKGKMFLYRPSNKQLDSEFPLSLSSHQLLVPDNRLVGGRWNILIDWTAGNEAYFYKEEINY